MKKIAQNVKLSIIILSLMLVIGIISVIFFIDEQDSYPNPYYKIDSRIENIEEEGKAFFATVGWIKVQGTNIDYPVIRETTEDYFSGLDYLWQPNNSYDTENRMTIYGHNIQNVSSRPLIADPTHTRFEQLMSFVNEKFAKKNLYIQYTKDGKDDLYKI
ncbi:MAG: hypothetical protein PUB18_03005, partial [bacterium]|nr:hypothetical protein [bacterium]